jgi:hypothetical protein
MQIEFSSDEYAYLARVSGKLMKARAEFSKHDMERGNNKVVKELAIKFSEHVDLQPETGHKVPLKRTHLRFIEEHLEALSKTIKETIRPEYIKRVENNEEYLKRLDEAERLVDQILGKVKVAL